MPSPHALLLTSVTLAALAAIVSGGRPVDTSAVGTQLRSGSVKELGAGKVLVAARGLPDPNFSETVILLAEHSADGAMGLVINQRTDVPVARAFPHLTPRQGPSSALYSGGPVALDGVVGLERSRAARPEARQVLPDVWMIASREALESLISSGAGSDRFRVYVGYAGWGPGQLERETLHGSWHVFRGDGALIFDPDPETLWQRQIRRTEERMVSIPREAPRLDLSALPATQG